MADVHRRIQLQEQDDLRYLVNNVLRVANQHIDQSLPRVEGDDPLRSRVEELVHEYISQTFHSASPNLQINGHIPTAELLTSLLSQTAPAAAVPEEEQFHMQNHKLHTRVRDLTETADSLTLELAELRRTAPGAVAATWKESFDAGVAKDEEVMRAMVAKEVREEDVREFLGGAASDGESSGDIMWSGNVEMVGALERQEDVEKSWGKAVAQLADLKRELGMTAARMEAARRAGEYVLASK